MDLVSHLMSEMVLVVFLPLFKDAKFKILRIIFQISDYVPNYGVP